MVVLQKKSRISRKAVFIFSYCFYIFQYFVITKACLATSPGSSPGSPSDTGTTTVVSPTTTTLAPTTTSTVATTTTVNECTACTTGQVTWTESTGAGSEDSTYTEPTTDSNGCLTLTAICAATNTGAIFMQFNINQGGPSSPTGDEVTAVLNCVDGNWVYEPEGQESRIITEVNCVTSV